MEIPRDLDRVRNKNMFLQKILSKTLKRNSRNQIQYVLLWDILRMIFLDSAKLHALYCLMRPKHLVPSLPLRALYKYTFHCTLYALEV